MSLNRGIILTATTYATTDTMAFTIIGSHILMTSATLQSNVYVHTPKSQQLQK